MRGVRCASMSPNTAGVIISLEGRTAIVTGGSRGIGRACSLTLARAGAKVAVHYHTREADADEVVSAIRKTGGTAIAVCAELSDEEQVAAMVDNVVAGLGTPAILVNNAGIWEGSAIDLMTLA